MDQLAPGQHLGGCSALGIAALSLVGCNKVKPGWSIEAPPPQYASGPTQTGHTTLLDTLTPEQTNWLCHQAGVWSHEPTGFPVACYNPRTDQVIVPDPKLWPSHAEWQAMVDHEMGHARGWRHNDDGTGTSEASLAPVSALLAAQARPSPTVAHLLASN